MESFTRRVGALLSGERAKKQRLGKKRSKSERLDTFLTNANLKLPPRSLAHFIQKCQELAHDKDQAEAYLLKQKEQGYREFYGRLFAPEMEIAQNFDHRFMRMAISFDRSATDEARADRLGHDIDRSKAIHDRTVSRRFAALLSGDVIAKTDVRAICEIGPAWGPSVAYLQKRFKPDQYHAYEIDGGWSRRLKEKFGIDVKTTDGETLSETEDASMDLVIASSCLYFMPSLKQWSYLRDIARVLRANGLAMFNPIVYERVDERYLQSLLDNYFPKRIFGLIPQRFIDMNFPPEKFELLTPATPASFGYEIHRKRSS